MRCTRPSAHSVILCVTGIRSLVGRNTGRYRFLKAEVALRTDDLEKAHVASQRIEKVIRGQVPHVEWVLV